MHFKALQRKVELDSWCFYVANRPIAKIKVKCQKWAGMGFNGFIFQKRNEYQNIKEKNKIQPICTKIGLDWLCYLALRPMPAHF